MVIKTVYHFVDSNPGVKISSNKRVNRKRRRRVLTVVLPGRDANELSWERKGFPWGPGLGGNYTD